MLLLTHFTKSCTTCKEIKIFTDFHKSKLGKYGIKSKCKECYKEYFLSNKDHFIELGKKYRSNNKEKIATSRAKYNIKNQDKIKYRMKNYQKNYRKTERGKAVDKNSDHRRRALEKKGDVTTNQIIALQNNAKVCYWCKCNLKGIKTHIDHYIPLSKGGKHTLNNLVVSCAKCNHSKSSKDPIVFANSIGKLL